MNKAVHLFAAALLFVFVSQVISRPPTCDDPVQCFANPCDFSDCLLECESNYCGGCNFYCKCTTDDHCKENEICFDSYCTPLTVTVGEGEECGGFTPPPYRQCEEGLLCINPQQIIIDAPGTCRRQCNTSSDCADESQYCSDSGACLIDLECFSDADCTNPDNNYPMVKCANPLIFCSRNSGSCEVSCNWEVPCYSIIDCPESYDCDYTSFTCKPYESTCDTCDGPPPSIPTVYCSDGTVGGPICTQNRNKKCSWQIRECPTDCVCTNPAPRVSTCSDGSLRTPYCGSVGKKHTCDWIVPECSECDCSTFPLPEMARICPDGSSVGPVCISTLNGCSYDFQCPDENTCSINGEKCKHPIGGECLGICDQQQCVLTSFDSCLQSPAVLFYITVRQYTPADTVLADLAYYSLLPKGNIQILSYSNRQFNVEFLDTNNLSANEAVNKLKENINNGDAHGSSLDSAKLIVLTSELVSSESEDANDHHNNNSSSAPLLIANLLLFTLLFI